MKLSDVFPQMKIQRQREFAESAQYSLGQLIDELNNISADGDCHVAFDFGYFRPVCFDSWRGSYEELSIEYTDEGDYDAMKLKEFITKAEECIDKVFTGYKGGDFTMTRDTPLWVSKYGEANNTQVVGLHQETGANGRAYSVIIRTAYESY